MRQIKYRGKDINTGEWVYGNLFKNGVAYRIIPFDAVICDSELSTYYEVIPESVGQATGKYDLKRVDAYEHDIFIDQNGIKMVITWSEATSCFHAGFLGEEYKRSVRLGLLEVCEVIGNIHDNPELL